MKGQNKLILNHAEMIRALEYYLNEVQFKERVVVYSVSEGKEVGSPVFEVRLSPMDEKELNLTQNSLLMEVVNS